MKEFFTMSNQPQGMDKFDFISQNMYPGSQQDRTQYAVPSQLPTGAQAIAISSDYDSKINTVTGEPMSHFKNGGLADAANYVQSRGRGNDTQLMHVTPGELRGLQALAMAHGGSLTINPHTGLPEAGFLEDVLPVAAAGAMMFLAPEVAPFIGGGLGLGTGALSTGVGMGLLAGGVSAAGQLLGSGKVDLGQTLRSGLIGGATAGAMQGFGMGTPTTNLQTDLPAVEMAKQAAVNTPPPVQGNFTNPAASYTAPPVTSNSFSYTPQGEMVPSNYPASVTGSTNPLTAAAPAVPPPGTDKSWWSTLTPGQKLMTGLGGVAGVSLLAGANQPKIQTPPTTSYIRPYTYAQTRNPNFGQPGQSYYTQKYTAQPSYQAAQGGLMAAGGSADSGYIPTSQAVQDYNKILSDRASEEYLRNPMPTAMVPASQRQAPVPTAPTDQAPAVSQDINGLYQYYLGRQPGKDETSQWTSQINGPVTPEMAQYFQQFTGGELAKTGYKPKGPDPFLGQANVPMSGPMAGPQNSGLPQYTYNAATKSYVPVIQNTPANFNLPPLAPVANNMDMGGGGAAGGGLMPYGLGGYSDGGRLLKGPGDGMSDNIPASIGHKQPARLADGEFVVPADVVSHLGNGSTDAGAKKLYSMMDKVREARTGNKKQGKKIKSEKYLPA